MYNFKYFFIFIIITLCGYLYEKYKFREEANMELEKYDKMKDFLFNDGSILSNKPILWVHIDYEINSRWWPSFYSRNTKKLNQPYLQLCIESIVRHCGDSFNICLIDDDSFSKLIPGWKSRYGSFGESRKRAYENDGYYPTFVLLWRFINSQFDACFKRFIPYL